VILFLIASRGRDSCLRQYWVPNNADKAPISVSFPEVSITVLKALLILLGEILYRDPWPQQPFLLCALFLAFPSYGRPDNLQKYFPSESLNTCNQIAVAISDASQVFFPCTCVIHLLQYRDLISVQVAPEYSSDIFHAASSIEPGSAGDVSKIVSHPTSMRQVLFTHIFIATYPRTKPDTFRSERWRTRYQPGIFLHERSTDLNVTLQ
jgi:hypothetical protein